MASRTRKNVVRPSEENIDFIDDEYESAVKTKPSNMKSTNKISKKKGSNLTSDQAVEFLIKERQAMDAVYAALREENEVLRNQIGQREPGSAKYHHSPDTGPSVASRARPLCREDKAEDTDEAVDDGTGGSISGVSFESTGMTSVGATSTGSERRVAATRNTMSQPQRVPALVMRQATGSPTTAAPLPESSRKTTRSGTSSHASQKKGNNTRKYSGLPMEIWKGSILWKIPYGGGGLAETRRVRIKHAPAAPGPRVKVIDLKPSTQEQGQGRLRGVEPRKGHMAFPPTLQWSNPDKPDDKSNCRELVLSKDDQVIEGYKSVAFLKGKSKGVPATPALCDKYALVPFYTYLPPHYVCLLI